MCANFQAKQTTLTCLAQICPKMDFWLEIQKTNVGIRVSILDSESAPPIYYVCQFSVKMDNFEFFGISLGKLLNYVRCFGSNSVEGVAESWVELGGG